MAGMPDLSPEDRGHQGHLVPFPRLLQEGVVGGPGHADLGRVYSGMDRVIPSGLFKTAGLKEGKFGLKPKLWCGRGRNSDIMPFVQQPWYEGTWIGIVSQICTNSLASMTWYNQHKNYAKHQWGKIWAVELCEETCKVAGGRRYCDVLPHCKYSWSHQAGNRRETSL